MNKASPFSWNLRKFWLTIATLTTLFAVFAIYVHAEKQIDEANELRLASYRLADQLRQSSNDLTRMARLYVGTGKPRYKEYYQDILDIRDGRKPQPDGYDYAYWDMVLGGGEAVKDKEVHSGNEPAVALLDQMRQVGFTEQEFGLLAEAKKNSDSLVELELEAMKRVSSAGPNAAAEREQGRQMLFGDEYHQAKARIMKPINEFFLQMNKRTFDSVERAKKIALLFRVLFIAVTLISIAMLWQSFVALRRILGCEVDSLYAHIARIGQEDFCSAIPVAEEMKNSVLGWLSVMQIQIANSDAERKNAMEALRESEQRTAAILNNLLDGVITINQHGLIETYSHSAMKIFGYDEDEVIGRNVNMLMPEPYHSEHDGYIKNYFTTGIPRIIGIGREVEGQRKDGSVFPMDLAVSASTHLGEPMFIGLVRDITERKKVEQMKNEFVSTVSHELRTPLTSISGSLGLVVGGALGEMPEQAKTMLDIAYKNSKRLALLINDLLDMEKLAAGKMNFDMQPQQLMPLVEQALEAVQAYGEQYQANFQLTARADGVEVRVDGLRLQQVLSNFLSNAAKFSPVGGRVEVAVSVDKNMVQVDVVDHGPGIPAEFQGRIFQKFSQADSSDTRQKGGTGLGLAISKELIERMNGLIGFDSEEGRGSRFYFQLPVWQAQEMPVQPNSAFHFWGARLLVVEGDSETGSLLSVMLNRAGYQTDVVANSETALNCLAYNKYAAMILDLLLPDQGGVALIRQLRSQAGTEALPIILVSAVTEDGKLAINGQFNAIDWISKPFEEEQLIAAVRRFRPVQSAGKPRVLHVEDDADLHHIVSVIGRDVAEFDIAHNLAEARAKLALERYSLVVLDIGLPDGSGWELLPDLKRLNPEPPVIVLSGTEATQEQQSHVQAALVKTRVPEQDLLDTLKRLLAANTLDEGKSTL